MYKIETRLLTPNNWSRPQIKLNTVKGIVLHYVANPMTSAKANRDYFESRKGGTKSYGSAHEIIDLDGDVIIAIPKNEISYNCGSSSYTPLKTQIFGSANPNNTTYGIECTHIDWTGKMTDLTYNTLVERIADLCMEFKLDPTKDVFLHGEITGKDCHRWFMNNPKEWSLFKNKVVKTISSKNGENMSKREELQNLLMKRNFDIEVDFEVSVKLFGKDATTAAQLLTAVKIEDANKPKPDAKTFQLEYKRVLKHKVGNGEDIRQLETALQMLGYNMSRYVDNFFGTATIDAVKAFQKDFGIAIDGVVGRNTVNKINEVLSSIGGGYSMITKYDSCIHVYETKEGQHVDAELGTYNKLERVSEMPNKSKVYAGKTPLCRINAGFFNLNGSTEHLGTYVDEGLYYKDPSNNFMDFIYYKNGKTELRQIPSLKEVSKLQGITHWAIGTSYSLVIDGKISITNTATFGHHTSKQPRTMIGQKANGNFVLVVANGRGKNGSKGLTSKEQANVMFELGCVNAANLDGGGSSTMVLHALGKDLIVNEPTDGVERRIGSAMMVY